MKIKNAQVQLIKKALAQPVNAALRKSLDDLLTGWMQQLQSGLHELVRRGNDVVGQHEVEIVALQEHEGCDMPLGLRGFAIKESRSKVEGAWYHKPWEDPEYGLMRGWDLFITSGRTRISSLRRDCPSVYLPLVERTETDLIPVRTQVSQVRATLREVIRLQKFVSRSANG